MLEKFIDGFLTGLAFVVITIGGMGLGLIGLLPCFLMAKYSNFLWLLLYGFIIPFLFGVIRIIDDKLIEV